MKFLYTCLTFCVMISSCADKHNAGVTKIKAAHEVRMKFLRVAPDLYLNMAPDSMKHWIPVFRNVLADDQKYRVPGLTKTDFTAKELAEQSRLDSQNLRIVSTYLDT